MTENEIVKALECCGDENNCAECPLKSTRFELDRSCSNELMKASAELIKSLKVEKEVIISGQEMLLKHISIQNENIANCKTEIERLQGRGKAVETSKQKLLDCFKCAGDIAIKKFAERLKNKAVCMPENEEYIDNDIVFVEDIDNTLKEMAGETNGGE